MKKTCLIFTLSLAALSCSQEKEIFQSPVEGKGKISIVLPKAVFDDDTKGSSMGQNGFSLTWDEGDRVNIYSEEGTLCLYRVDGANGLSAEAGFDGGGFELKDGHTYYSVFPAVYDPDSDMTSVPVSFEDDYQAANGDASHMKPYAHCIARATCEGGNMQFNYEYFVGFLQMIIEVRGGTGGGLTKLKLTADSAIFCKNGAVSVVNGALAPGEMSNTMEINLDGVAPQPYPEITGNDTPCYLVNMVLAPFGTSEITISVTTADGEEIVLGTQTFQLQAGHAKRLNYILLKSPKSIAGLWFARGDLYTTGSGFDIADSWEPTVAAYNPALNNTFVGSGNLQELDTSEQGSTSAGRYYFNWLELGDVFSTQPVGTDNKNNIDNTRTVNEFRMPTREEWGAVISGPRTGSTVNGTSGVRWCYTLVNGVTGGINGNNQQAGIILFPDGENIVNAGITENTFNARAANKEWYNTSMTLEQLNSLLSNGCAFLPVVKYFENTWSGISGFSGTYWSASCSTMGQSYYLSFQNNLNAGVYSDMDKVYFYPVRLVRDVN